MIVESIWLSPPVCVSSFLWEKIKQAVFWTLYFEFQENIYSLFVIKKLKKNGYFKSSKIEFSNI